MSVLHFTPTKKSLIRETLVAIPAFLLVALWLSLVIFDIVLFPGLDYGPAMLLYLIIPLFLSGALLIAYGCLVVADALSRKYPNVLATVLTAVLLWLLSQHLSVVLYIVRTILFFSHRGEDLHCKK